MVCRFVTLSPSRNHLTSPIIFCSRGHLMDRRQFLQASAGSLVLSSCLPNFVSAFADEPKSAALIQTLPKDGSWATLDEPFKFSICTCSSDFVRSRNEKDSRIKLVEASSPLATHRPQPQNTRGRLLPSQSRINGLEKRHAQRAKSPLSRNLNLAPMERHTRQEM